VAILTGWLLIAIIFVFFLFVVFMSVIRSRRRMDELRKQKKHKIG
jgi:preprotein translocase subunit YajC